MFKKLKAGFESLKAGLARTHNAILGTVESTVTGVSRDELLEKLEEALIMSDVGIKASTEIVDSLRTRLVGWGNGEKFKEYLRDYWPSLR